MLSCTLCTSIWLFCRYCMKLRVAFSKWWETGYEMVIFDKNRSGRVSIIPFKSQVAQDWQKDQGGKEYFQSTPMNNFRLPCLYFRTSMSYWLVLIINKFSLAISHGKIDLGRSRKPPRSIMHEIRKPLSSHQFALVIGSCQTVRSASGVAGDSCIWKNCLREYWRTALMIAGKSIESLFLKFKRALFLLMLLQRL